MFFADIFYGTSALIGWCQKQGWQYRIRLKGNLIFQHEGAEITASQAAQMQMTALKMQSLTIQPLKPTLAFCMNQVTKSIGL